MAPIRDSDDRRPAITPQLALRIAVLGGIALALFAIVFLRLWYLQVLSGDEYLAQARENRTRTVRIQAPRGEILDRHNRVLVDNRPANVVQIEPQGLPDQVVSDAAEWGRRAGERLAKPADERGDPVPLPPVATPELSRLYERLGRVLKMRPQTIHRRVIEQLAQLPYSAVIVRSDVSARVLAFIKERQEHFRGVDVERVFLRAYPRDTLAAHLVGHVGEVSSKELEHRRYAELDQGAIIGKAGLEYAYDRHLRGRDGAKILRVDAHGRFVGEALNRREPILGRDVRLSLDLGLQRTGEQALREIGGGLPGAFVALNPRNGQVYAMGSHPTFDPALFAKPIPESVYERLTSEDNGAPLVNRAVNAAYASGSTFKPITALAALDKGVVTPDTVINDAGCMMIGTRKACNAQDTPYGPVALRRALTVSSDIYFYTVGIDLFSLAGEPLQRWARRMGLGRRTGIDLPEEARGRIPDRRWRVEMNEIERECRKDNDGRPCYLLDVRKYSAGDNANVAVGQGEVAISPLQMAVAYAGIVTGGRIPRPHLGLQVQDRQGRLVERIDPGSARRVRIEDAWQQAIMDGLRGAASGDGGTSTKVFAGWPHERLPVYGKTGTAETRVDGRDYDQSWYVAYVRHDTKPIVIAATIERGGYGADRAAPLVRRMLADWFDLPAEQARPPQDAAARSATD